jgi:hypothetical protein
MQDTSYLDRANLIVQQLAPSAGCQQDDAAVQHEAYTLVVWDTLHALSEQVGCILYGGLSVSLCPLCCCCCCCGWRLPCVAPLHERPLCRVHA